MPSDQDGPHQLEIACRGRARSGNDADTATAKTSLFHHLVEAMLCDPQNSCLMYVRHTCLSGQLLKEGFLGIHVHLVAPSALGRSDALHFLDDPVAPEATTLSKK
jgi:hypothetical protein